MSEKSLRRVHDILGFIEKIEHILKGKSEDDFLRDEILQLAIERLVQNVGEAAMHISDEVKTKMPTMPWKEITGMRHVLVHGYDIVDDAITWKTAKEDMMMLKDAVQKYLESQ